MDLDLNSTTCLRIKKSLNRMTKIRAQGMTIEIVTMREFLGFLKSILSVAV